MKTIHAEKLESREPTLLGQAGKIQESAEALLNVLPKARFITKGTATAAAGCKGDTEDQERKINELKKCIQMVKVQASELERASQEEKEQIKQQYSDKLNECNKLIREQNAELQRVRKQLEEARQDTDKAKVQT